MHKGLVNFFGIMLAVGIVVSIGEAVKLSLIDHADSMLSHAITVSLSAVAAALAGYVTFRNASIKRDAHGESDKLHRFFIDHIDEGAFLIENGKITDVSTVGAVMLGYSRDELIGQTPTFVVSERSKENVRQRVREGNEDPYEAEGQCKDGAVFPIWVHGRELEYDGRRVRLTTLQDITERKQTEATLRKLSRAVEQNPSAVFITDTEGTIEYVNTKFTEITGYSSQDAIGQNPRILRSEDTPDAVYADLWAAIKSGNEWRREIKDKRKDGSYFWAYVTIAPVKNNNDEITHYIAAHEDITRRKDAEASALVALEKADVANRAKSELLANMSHELRTPLNAIIGFSDTINAEIFGPLGHEKYAEYIHDIHDSGVHLLELVNDILDVSAIEAGKLELHKEDLDIAALVDACIRLVRHRADAAQVDLDFAIAEALPPCYADQRRIKQVLLNLLTNAVKFTPSGGKVALNVSDDGAGGHVFSVVDTGIGMSPADMAKAMTQFGQVDSSLSRKQEGTGLGLPLSKGLVELHGGALTLKSEPGMGTAAMVTLPRERDAAIA